MTAARTLRVADNDDQQRRAGAVVALGLLPLEFAF
jgi:hypothetical protein